MKPPIPSESIEQQAVIAWADSQPLIRGRLYSIPNGANKSLASATKFKREGLRKGYPDLGLDIARGPYHGLRIEMKRVKGGVISDAQDDWLLFLNTQGYCACVCEGAEQAIVTIKQYLALPTKE